MYRTTLQDSQIPIPRGLQSRYNSLQEFRVDSRMSERVKCIETAVTFPPRSGLVLGPNGRQ